MTGSASVRPQTRARFLGAGAAAIILSLTLSGCVSWFTPPESSMNSTPTDEAVAPRLERFYTQILEWSNCGEALQCATASAPVDWENPEGDTIELALVRQTSRARPNS